MTAMLPAHLSETLNNLGDAAHELAEEVRADREQRVLDAAAAAAAQKRANRRMTALLVIIAVLIASLWAMAVANRRTNAQNAQIIQEIRSCTTVGGKCYEQGTQRTNEAVGRLLSEMMRAQIAIAVCANTYPGADEAEIQACAMARTAKPAASEHPKNPTD